MFIVIKDELELFRSQIGTTNLAKTRALPYAFTKLREFSKHYYILAKQILAVERKSDKQYKELKKALEELMAASDVLDEKVKGG